MDFCVRFVIPKDMFMELNRRVEGLIAARDGSMLGMKRKYNRTPNYYITPTVKYCNIKMLIYVLIYSNLMCILFKAKSQNLSRLLKPLQCMGTGKGRYMLKPNQTPPNTDTRILV